MTCTTVEQQSTRAPYNNQIKANRTKRNTPATSLIHTQAQPGARHLQTKTYDEIWEKGRIIIRSIWKQYLKKTFLDPMLVQQVFQYHHHAWHAYFVTYTSCVVATRAAYFQMRCFHDETCFIMGGFRPVFYNKDSCSTALLLYWLLCALYPD